jgi:hypothetical protein
MQPQCLEVRQTRHLIGNWQGGCVNGRPTTSSSQGLHGDMVRETKKSGSTSFRPNGTFRHFWRLERRFSAEFTIEASSNPPARPVALLPIQLTFAVAPNMRWGDSSEPSRGDATVWQFPTRHRPLVTNLPPMHKYLLEIGGWFHWSSVTSSCSFARLARTTTRQRTRR